jgi:hypothetical protein
MPLTPLIKPLPPVLQVAHPFVNAMEAAWLFTDGSGVTIADWSGNNRHLVAANVSDGSWLDSGLPTVRLRFTQHGELHSKATPGIISAFNFSGANSAWTETLCVRVDDVASGKPRIRGRAGNAMEFAILQDRHFEVYNGTWVNLGSSAASGAYDIWHMTHASDATLTLYKNGVLVTAVGSAAANTGEVGLWSPSGDASAEWTEGEQMAHFIHSRALDAAEVASHTADPFAAFTFVPSIRGFVFGSGPIIPGLGCYIEDLS